MRMETPTGQGDSLVNVGALTGFAPRRAIAGFSAARWEAKAAADRMEPRGRPGPHPQAPARLLSFLLALLGGGLPAPAEAQERSAQIRGTVLARETNTPVAGVTVVVSGPALQEYQTEVTDPAGAYLITQLPPGDDYQVSFYLGYDARPRLIKTGLRLSNSKTVAVSATLTTDVKLAESLTINERAPNINVSSAGLGVELNQELLQSIPLRGRTYESALQLGPGAVDASPRPLRGGAVAGGEVGVSLFGATGADNTYYLDGLNTTDPSQGLLSAELSPYLIKEINVLAAGYQAEYGRAIGGVVAVTTKSGSGQFHGGVYGSFQPYQADALRLRRYGETLSLRPRNQSGAFDVGADVGGPLWRNRIWFYLGFASASTQASAERAVLVRTYDARTGGAELDAQYTCPAYLASAVYCQASRAFAERADPLAATTSLPLVKRLYNGIAKLQFNLHADHEITLSYIATPATIDASGNNNPSAYRIGSAETPLAAQRTGDFDILASDLATSRITQVTLIHDAIAHYTGKVLNRRLLFEVLYGYHYQSLTQLPQAPAEPYFSWSASQGNPFSLADFEDIPECRQTTPFNPCPITLYQRGFGLYRTQILQRHHLQLAATYFLKLFGLHAIKAGAIAELLSSELSQTYTGTDLAGQDDGLGGHRAYRALADGSVQIVREYAAPGLLDANGMLQSIHFNRFTGQTATRNYSFYLRDSWNVGWVPGLLLNLGVRWEGQELFASDGSRVVDIKDSWAPRIGAVFDFTQLTSRPGRGKIFFNYGRFYQAIPLSLSERQLTGEAQYSSGFSSTCPRRQLQPGGRVLPMLGRDCELLNQFDGTTVGGRYPLIAPGLQGGYINELVLGINYEVGFDVVLGASYLHRDLGSVIEDVSPDGGATLLFANPGVPTDPGQIQALEQEVALLRRLQSAPGAGLNTQQRYLDAISRLEGYRSIGSLYSKPRRDYDALILTASKKLSHRFSLLASYTYSRTLGNYSGNYSATNGRLAPHTLSAFNSVDLLANQSGPLPSDRPHDFKLAGFYEQPITKSIKMSFGLTFSAYSGRPINVLGAHPVYGNLEVFILPRGSGGRTPPITQLDLRVGYEQALPRNVMLVVFAECINALNQQAVTNVDDMYTVSVVGPLQGGRVEELLSLKTSAGARPTLNPNYGQPTAFQEPFYLRLGGRLAF